VSAFVAVQLGFLDPRCDRGAVLCRSDPVVIALADEGRACDRAEPVPHVMPFAGFELGPMSRRGRGVHLSCGQAFGQRTIGWVIVKPALVPTAVNDHERGCNPFLGRELEQRLRRIGGPDFATGRGARQDEAVDSLRVGYREALRHQATEAHARHPTRTPTRCLHQTNRVGGHLGHRVRTRYRSAVAKPTLVPRQQIALGSQKIDKQSGILQGRPRSIAEQQARTTARSLPVQLDSVHGATEHLAMDAMSTSLTGYQPDRVIPKGSAQPDARQLPLWLAGQVLLIGVGRELKQQ
jgi:hypothetical protein